MIGRDLKRAIDIHTVEKNRLDDEKGAADVETESNCRPDPMDVWVCGPR